MSITIAYQEVTPNTENPAWSVVNGIFDEASGVGLPMIQSSSTLDANYNDYPYSIPLTLYADFSNQPSFNGFSVGFSSEAYCPRIKVTFYSGSVGVSQTFNPSSSAYAYYQRSLPTPYTGIKFEFLSASKPNATIVTEFFQLGKVTMWSDADLVDFPRITQEVCPVGTDLPYDISEFTLYLPDGAPRLQRWDRITIKQNSTFVARHYIDTAERDGNNYHIKGMSIIGVLEDMPYDGYFLDSGTISTANLLRSTANNVDPADAGSAAATGDTARFIVDSSFDNDEYYNYPGAYRGNLPPGTRRSAIHRVVQCRGSLLRTLPNGTLNLLPCPSSASAGTNIPTSAIFQSGLNLQRKTPYSSLTHTFYSHTAEAETTIWSGTLPAGTTHVTFSAPCYITSVTSGVTVTTARNASYVWWADLTMENSQTVTILGMPLKAVETTVTQIFETGAGAVANPLTISGNDFILYDSPYGNVNAGALNAYYSSLRQNAELSCKIICSSIVPVMGARYNIVLSSGTMKGWLTKMTTTLSSNNRYAEITLTGIWEDAE